MWLAAAAVVTGCASGDLIGATNMHDAGPPMRQPMRPADDGGIAVAADAAPAIGDAAAAPNSRPPDSPLRLFAVEDHGGSARLDELDNGTGAARNVAAMTTDGAHRSFADPATGLVYLHLNELIVELDPSDPAPDRRRFLRPEAFVGPAVVGGVAAGISTTWEGNVTYLAGIDLNTSIAGTLANLGHDWTVAGGTASTADGRYLAHVLVWDDAASDYATELRLIEFGEVIATAGLGVGRYHSLTYAGRHGYVIVHRADSGDSELIAVDPGSGATTILLSSPDIAMTYDTLVYDPHSDGFYFLDSDAERSSRLYYLSQTTGLQHIASYAYRYSHLFAM